MTHLQQLVCGDQIQFSRYGHSPILASATIWEARVSAAISSWIPAPLLILISIKLGSIGVVWNIRRSRRREEVVALSLLLPCLLLTVRRFGEPAVERGVSRQFVREIYKIRKKGEEKTKAL